MMEMRRVFSPQFSLLVIGAIGALEETGTYVPPAPTSLRR
jgi:hypothetical protein